MYDRRLRAGLPGLLVPIALLCAIALAAAAGEGTEQPATPAFEPPPGLRPGWYAMIRTTMGDVLARLLPEQAPQSVAHFAGLAQGTLPWVDPLTGETVRGPFYDGMMIHTVSAGRMFETGDAGSMGRGTPMLFVPETEGTGPVNFNQSYVLGMTRMAGARVSASRFFVTVASQPALNGESPCFGVVVDGRETVFNISQVKAYSNQRPITDVFVERIYVFSVGDVAPLPEPQVYEPRRFDVGPREGSAPPPAR